MTLTKIKKVIFLYFISFNFLNLYASNATDYFRSINSGNWTTLGNWESSSDNINWSNSTLYPTSFANYITIQNGNTIKINSNTTASSILIKDTGCLTFDGLVAQDLIITGNLIIKNTTSSFITQLNGNYGNTLQISGDIINNGVLDLSRGGTTLICDITFNKNGNQTVSGTGSLTRFNEISLNMGNSNTNILEIKTDNFNAPDGFIETISGVANRLKNGTLKLSGNFSYSGSPFIVNSFNNMIVSSAGFWLDNPNINITGFNDSFDVSGLLKITSGILNIGSTNGNSLRYISGSYIQIEGGKVNVAGRIQGKTVASSTTNFNQSGGLVTILVKSSSSETIASLDFTALGSTFSMSGGYLILRNESANTIDVLIRCSTIISGGILQFGDENSINISSKGFCIFSDAIVPNISIYSVSINNYFPSLKIAHDLAIKSSLSIGQNCILDASNDNGLNSFDISLSGDFENNGTFTNRTKKVLFYGNTSQSISGTTSTLFNNLTINNSSTSGVILNSSIQIEGELSLFDGNLFSSNINKLTLTSSATSTLGNSSSFVDGPLTKIGVTNFTFPIGKNTKLGKVNITNLSTEETFTAEYFDTSFSDLKSNSTETNPVNSISTIEYWAISQKGNATAKLELFWENAIVSNISNSSNLKIMIWDTLNSYWSKSNFDNYITSGSFLGSSNGSIKTNSNLNSFGKFTFGFNTVHALPISFGSFSTKIINDIVELKWNTLSEKNNDYFTLEKTIDGINFDFLKIIYGAGNHTGELTYNVIDSNPFYNISYYRLCQTDFDGVKIILDIKSVVLEQKKDANLNIHPNPISKESKLKINLVNENNHPQKISIINLQGEELFTKEYTSENEKTVIEINLSELNLLSGIYIIREQQENLVFSKKLIIN